MEVDSGGPIRNPKAESYVPKLPQIDGATMGKGASFTRASRLTFRF